MAEIDVTDLVMGGQSQQEGQAQDATNPAQSMFMAVPSGKGLRFVNNPIAMAQAKSGIATQQKLTEAQQKTSEDFGQSSAMIDNLVSAVKGAYAQSSGGGLLAGTAGNIASALRMPNTGLISGLKTTARDTAAAYARLLTGSSRGVLGMFNRILDTIPSDATLNPQQAASAMTEMYLTAAALEKGIKEKQITPEELQKMNPDEVQSWAKTNQLGLKEQQELYDAMAEKFKAIAPRQQIDLNGNVSAPQPNALSAFVSSLAGGIARGEYSPAVTSKVQKSIDDMGIKGKVTSFRKVQ